jgi:hypothetical protein
MAPFYNWSMKDIYDFWLTHVRPPLDRASTGWTSFTVLVLDANSTKDRKCGVCSNAPDLGEQGDGEILKSVRMHRASRIKKRLLMLCHRWGWIREILRLEKDSRGRSQHQNMQGRHKEEGSCRLRLRVWCEEKRSRERAISQRAEPGSLAIYSFFCGQTSTMIVSARLATEMPGSTLVFPRPRKEESCVSPVTCSKPQLLRRDSDQAGANEPLLREVDNGLNEICSRSAWRALSDLAPLLNDDRGGYSVRDQEHWLMTCPRKSAATGVSSFHSAAVGLCGCCSPSMPLETRLLVKVSRIFRESSSTCELVASFPDATMKASSVSV